MLRVMPDMTDLEALITRLVNDRTLLRSGEAGTRMGAVNPTLRALGWDTDNLDEVDPEFADGSGGKVDYCLRHQGRNLVLIEAKRASADLALHQGQLLQYAFGIGVELAALTNGLDWWLYLPMKGGRSFEGRRFARIDFRSQDASRAAEALTRFLNRDTTVSGRTLEEAEREFERRESDELVRAALPNVWTKVLADQRLRDLLAHEVRESTGVRPNADTIVEFLQGKGAAPATPTRPPDGPPKPESASEAPPQPPTAGDAATFKGQRLSAFWLDGTRYEASNWRRMLQAVCEHLANEAGATFGQRVDHLRGRTRVYFSGNPDDLYRPMEIANSGFYAEGNLSADDCVRLARRALEAVRGSDSGLQIEAEERANDSGQKTRTVPPSSSSPSPADLVVALLEEVGTPLHYREIERRLRDSGKFEAGGRDPANTLLGRFFNDPRLHRTGRGTYDLLARGNASPAPIPQESAGAPTAAPEMPDRATFTGRRPAAFWLDGSRYEVRSWPHLVQALSEQLARETGASFAERVANVRGRTRVYFSEQPDDLHSARRLGDSTLYVEANLGPDRSARVAELTLQAVRGNHDGFRIELAD